MSGDHNQYQKGRRWNIRKSGDDLLVCFDYTGTPEDKHIRFVRAEQQNDFECPRCGHCCKAMKTEKREWQGLTGDEARKFYEKYTDREELIHAIDRFLEDKNK